MAGRVGDSMTPLYPSTVYNRTLPIGSFWETTVVPPTPETFHPLQGEVTTEIAIIGGGITGLSAALHLARDHHLSVQVLEAGVPAWGASGRNGGFCCIGSTRLSPAALLARFGYEQTRRYYQDQRDGVELVRQLATDEGIEIEAQGDGEIVSAHRPSRWRDLVAAYEFLTEVAGYPCQLWSSTDRADQAFTSPDAFGAMKVGVGFGLNPLKYSRGLAIAAQRHGAALHAYSPVLAWEKTGSWHLLHTPGGTLRASTVLIATNGYTHDTLHPSLKGCLLPTLSNILTTRPLTPAERAAQGWHTDTPIYDTRELLFYFRMLPDGRLLFGSRGGTVGDGRERDRRQRAMIRSFRAYFPAWQHVEFTHFWNGLVCISAALTPHLGWLSTDASVAIALAYHGNGIATGTWCGRAAAALLAGVLHEDEVCAVFRQPLQRFPLPALRRWYLRSTYAFYEIKDRLVP